MKYKSFSVRARGWDHIILGRVCQDSAKSFACDGYAVAAVADGHGASPYFRSDKGSEYAVNCAVKNLKSFCKKAEALRLKSPNEYNTLVDDLENPEKQSVIAEKLFRKIHSDWKKSVFADLKRHPFDVTEYEELPREFIEAYTGGNLDYYSVAYGTTLICFAACSDFWIAFQLGDGACISIYNDKIICKDIPSEPDELLLRHTTRSMCNPDACDKFRYYIGRKIPRSVVAVSDGVVNSFDDIYNNRELYSYLLDTEKYIRNQNSEKYKCELRKKIYTLSEENSGDDVSLAGFYVVFENNEMRT